MKPAITKIAFCVVVLLCANFMYAHATDYVITTKGDTLQCTISGPTLGFGKGHYKIIGSNASEKLDEKTIKEFYIEKRKQLHRAVYKDGKNKPEFMKVIEDGPICLYELYYVNTNTYNVTEWYAGKNSDKVMSLKTNAMMIGNKNSKERRDVFGDLLKDKPEVYDKYAADQKFSYKQIQYLVHLYNTGQELKN